MIDETPQDVLRTVTSDMTERFTEELGAFVRERIPSSMTDQAFAAASSSLMIALNRQLAATAVAFGETHRVDPEDVKKLVLVQFRNNHTRALKVSREGVTVQ